MSHSVFIVHAHVVFSTKDRRPLIDSDLQLRLWPYLSALTRDKGLTPLIVGGVENHVHMLVALPPLYEFPAAMQKIKCCSSKWINDTCGRGRRFAWQEGYGAFAIAASQIERTVLYIKNQKQHHRKMSFEDEYVAFLKRNGVEYDPRYIFG
jgi:putative transposase